MSSFLHKLWDETLAGPPPDDGLGKLRKYRSFPASQPPPVKISNEIQITRSITIIRSNSTFRNSDDRSEKVGDSLAGISSPRTPITPGTPGGEMKTRFSWRKSSTESSERDV